MDGLHIGISVTSTVHVSWVCPQPYFFYISGTCLPVHSGNSTHTNTFTWVFQVWYNFMFVDYMVYLINKPILLL